MKPQPEHIPADFNPNKHILLVAPMPQRNKPEEVHKGITRKLDKALKKYCPYKYEIVTIKDIVDETRYTDTSVYKYAILNSLSGITHTTTMRRSDGVTLSPTATTTYINFRFYDRANGIDYGSTNTGMPYMKMSVAGFFSVVEKTLAGYRK